jgi:gas vesicle protein
MKYISGFFAGMLVGVAVGFLFAPTSGEELRAQIQQEAQVEMKKIEAEWHKRLQQVQKTIDETRVEVKSMVDKNKGDEAAEIAAA